MGLNSCSCLRSLDDLSAETDLNGDGEIEGLNFPNNNHNLFSSTDDSTNLTGAGRMSYLMKVNTYDSGVINNTAFYTMKTGAAVERIQSVFRGSNFRKKFLKNKKEKERLNKEKNKEIIKEKNNEEKKEEINTDIIQEKIEIDENNFIPEMTRKAEKNFEDPLNYENGWKKYINEEENKESKEVFSQQKINDIINNNQNLISTKEEGDFIFIKNEKCLFKGKMEKPTPEDNNDININLLGKGELYYQNGVKYEGIFINGKLNGIGRYIDDNFVCYEGIFKEGDLNGKGMQIKSSEDENKKIYIGDLKNYLKEGKGILKCKNYTYEGDFVNDKKEGKGKLSYNDNGNFYEGEFKNDGINGYGLYTFSNNHTYEGEFSNGVFNGKGFYKWQDGCYFKGIYKNGVREGLGEYKFSDGKLYNGPFSKGKPNGKGLITIKGHTIDCEFKDGKLITDLKASINMKKKPKNSNN